MKKALGVILALAIVLASAVGCTSVSGNSTSNVASSQLRKSETATEITTGAAADTATENTNKARSDAKTESTSKVRTDSSIENVVADLPDYSGATTIELGDTIAVSGSGASVSGTTVTITAAGSYMISGTLDDGQIVVNTQNKETVKLILSGVDIACSTNAPIYVRNAEKTVITLADGTENRVTDGDSYIFGDAESDEPNAAIFSHDDLTINGDGSLTVNANYNNGIQSKDDLKITGGQVTVNAVNDGIKGRDSIVVKNADITVNAGADGMQSNNDEDSEKGYVSIESGTLNITAGADGIQAETSLMISGGNLTISSGGGSTNSRSGNIQGNWGMGNNPDNSSSSVSAKGIKARVAVTITGGTIDVDSSDDSIHSNDSLTINGGNITLASGDDAIHADSTLEINGGDISITKCYEGLESAAITINDGSIRLVASDDGINAASGNGGFPIAGRPGPNDLSASGNNYLYINGGYIAVDATGDGFDINGPINMTGGKVIINGPIRNDNGALDYSGAFKMTGGFLVAVGSAGMAQAPSTSSTQYAVMLNFPSPQPAGTPVHLETEDGKEILTFVPTKAYQSVVLCSPDLKKGETYIVYFGGSSTGTVTDGLYSGGIYTAGTQITSFTISSIVTMIGSYGGRNRGGFRP